MVLTYISEPGHPCMVEGQKMETISITQFRRGRKINCRNANISRESHKRGPSKFFPGTDTLGQHRSPQRSRSKQKRRDNLGSSLVVQLGLLTFTVMAPGSIPGWELRSCKQSTVTHTIRDDFKALFVTCLHYLVLPREQGYLNTEIKGIY